ncbi:MAG: 50S ribosomal protein L10 [Holosporales bacterium]|jgi:large subunit ribosomal protein L10|nr:50S ribosomal protein L10 [Holosporales bacterium]
MKRLEKESFVSQMRDELLGSSIVVAVDRTSGITVEEMTRLRRGIREAEANFKVMKNTLARIAIKDSALEVISDYFNGPTGLAYSNDPVALAKAIYDFIKSNERLSVLGGVMDGKVISKDVIKSLAALPSQDELRAKIIGLLTANASKIVRTIKEPSARVARVVAAKG